MPDPYEHPSLLLTGKPVETLDEYIRKGGLAGLANAERSSPIDIIGEIEKSGLQGRGGAGFPVYLKWRALFDEKASLYTVVCNAAEGEPGTIKDRFLILSNPYPMIEGMLIAACVLRPQQMFIGTKACFNNIVTRLNQALAEMERENIVKPGFVTLVQGPDSYLMGEEKALLGIVAGTTDYPSPGVLAPYIQGLTENPGSYSPTLVNNVETFSAITHILKNGGVGYKAIGSHKRPGTFLVTLSGDITLPGVYEVTGNMGLSDLLEHLGGGVPGGRGIKAVFPCFGSRPVTEDLIRQNIRLDALDEYGITPGSFGFMVYDRRRSMVAAAERFAGFFAAQTCGQCIPCYSGLQTVHRHLKHFLEGKGKSEELERVLQLCGTMTSQARCRLPWSASVLISGIMETFPEEFSGSVQGVGDLPDFPVI